MKRPGDDQPESPGGRAAERLGEFLRQRLPAGASPQETEDASNPQGPPETEQDPSPPQEKKLLKGKPEAI